MKLFRSVVLAFLILVASLSPVLAAKIGDLIQQSSTTIGTGDLTLDSVTDGTRTFNAEFSTGGTDKFYYFAQNEDAIEWEIGTGHLSSASVLVRDTVISSSNSNSLVNFSAGTKDIVNDIPASLQTQLETLSSDLAGKQPLDSDLTSIAALGSASDKSLYTTSAHTWAEYTLTAAGRALIDDADASAQRTTLGLGTLATQSGTFSGTSSGTNTGDQTTAGTTNRIDVTNGATSPVIDISSAYVGQNTITTLGTIGTGTWQGTKVGLAYGGTNADLSATGGTSQVLKQVSSGAAVTVAQLAASDLSNGTTGSGGGVVLATGPTLSAPVLGTPASVNLSNATALPCTATPALTGNVTTSAGSCSTAIAAGVVTNTMLAGSIDLTAKVTGILPSSNGGTANGFTKFSGPASTEKTFTLPNSNATILYSGGDAGTPSALVGTNISGTASSLTAGNVTTNANLTGPITSVGNAVASLSAHAALIGNGTSAIATVAPSTSGNVLTSNGTDWTSAASAGGAPSGAAGGDLTGTYPNPTVATGAVTASKMSAPASLHNAGSAGGTANAQTLTPTPALDAYVAGDMRTFLPVATNTSGTVTVAVSGLATRNIKKFIGGAVVALGLRDLIINQPAMIVDDGTQYILMNPQNYTQGADIASSGTLDLDSMTGDYVHVTGTTTITAITLAQGRQATVVFDGILTLTNGASLILPTGANITTAAGDTAIFRGEASGVVRGIYHRGDGSTLAANNIQNFIASGTWTKPAGLSGKETVIIELWDSGAAGGGRTSTGSGGGGCGGAYHRLITTAESLGGTETVTVGAVVAGVAGNTTGASSNRSAITLNGTTFTPSTAAATGGGTGSGTTGAGICTVATISTVSTVTAEAGQASTSTAGPYVVAGGTFVKAAQAGAAACSTAANGGNGSGLGGTFYHALGRGGVAGLNTGGDGGDGTAPGGGGGGAVQNGVPGDGARGQVTVTVLR